VVWQFSRADIHPISENPLNSTAIRRDITRSEDGKESQKADIAQQPASAVKRHASCLAIAQNTGSSFIPRTHRLRHDWWKNCRKIDASNKRWKCACPCASQSFIWQHLSMSHAQQLPSRIPLRKSLSSMQPDRCPSTTKTTQSILLRRWLPLERAHSAATAV
jgi:hypothetical protein